MGEDAFRVLGTGPDYILARRLNYIERALLWLWRVVTWCR